MSPSVETVGTLLWLMNEELVLGAEPVNWGHDATLNQSSLAVPPEERIRRNTVYARRMAEIRGIATRARR